MCIHAAGSEDLTAVSQDASLPGCVTLTKQAAPNHFKDHSAFRRSGPTSPVTQIHIPEHMNFINICHLYG